MKKLKHMLANFLLRKVLKAPLIHEVFVDLDEDKKEKYAMEAKALQDSEFYKEFIGLMEQIAISKMAREANTSTDMLFGKALLFYVSLQRTKMKEFAGYKRPKQEETKKW